MRFAEDRLAEAATRGVRQYVILGAGLDTFPWRQPDFATTMQIFAADHPASLTWIHCGFASVDCPNLQILILYLLTSKNNGEILPVLRMRIPIPALASFCSALGLTQYLDGGAVEALLGFTAGLSHGSEIVLSLAPPDDELSTADLETVTKSAARTAALGEPWKSRLRPGELVDRLRQLGFQRCISPDAGTCPSEILRRAAAGGPSARLGTSDGGGPLTESVSVRAQGRFGSFASLSAIAARSSMSAPPPIATDFCAWQRMTLRAQAV